MMKNIRLFYRYTKSKYAHWSRMEWRELIPTNSKALLGIFSSLRSRNFRLYFIGQCISLSGSWIQNIAMSWLVYRLTDSVFLLSTVTFLNLIPSLFLTPFAGVISDRFDRFKILFTTQALMMLQVLLLALLTLMGWVEVWHIMALSLLAGVISAAEAPARQSFYTSLVGKEEMTNAIALNSVTINATRFIGPTIGGLLIAWVGEGYCFLINGISYLAVLVALGMMHLPKHQPNMTSIRLFRELREGISYIHGSLPIKAVLVFLAAFSFFAIPFMTIVPAWVRDVLGGDSQMLGYVMSSIGAGSMTAALYLASRKRVQGLGKVVTISAVMFGVGLIGLSFVQSPMWVYPLCFPVGFGMISVAAACNTLLQTVVEDHVRGRVMSFFTMAFAGVSPLGSLFAGSISSWIGMTNLMLGSGVIALIAVAIYEYYRPIVRMSIRDTHARKGIPTEIARGMGDSYRNPF